VAKPSLISQGNNHVFICGITRSGKTYFAKEAARRLRGPVLFFNVQDEDLTGAPWIDFTPFDDGAQLLRALRKNCKINFQFCDLSEKQIMLVMGSLIDQIMQRREYSQDKPVYIVIDEAQILSGPALDAAIAASTRGLARGVRLISITQRPALVNKTIYTQAQEQYLFRLAPSEGTYLKNKGIDYDFCLTAWEQFGDHSYIYYDGYKIEGRPAI